MEIPRQRIPDHRHDGGTCNNPAAHRPPPPAPRRWALHYCGFQHNPKYPCPAPVMEVGGYPVSELDPCKCQGLEHAQDCPRRRAIRSLYNRRPEK